MFEIISTKEMGHSKAALSVQIEKIADRFAHSVWLFIDEQKIKILQSVEGNDEEESPPSPPIQDLSVENRPTSQVALGVGMAGSSHWSISMEAAANKGRIVFDVACHARAETPRFGSAYQLEEGVKPFLSGGDCQLFVTGLTKDLGIRFQPAAVDGVSAVIDCDSIGRLEIKENIVSAKNSHDKGRWIYELSICESV